MMLTRAAVEFPIHLKPEYQSLLWQAEEIEIKFRYWQVKARGKGHSSFCGIMEAASSYCFIQFALASLPGAKKDAKDVVLIT